MVRARIREDEGLAAVCRRLGGADGGLSGCGERDGGERTRQEALADRTGASLRGRSVCGDVGALADGHRQAGSGMAQPGQGATELGFPRPVLWQMQG